MRNDFDNQPFGLPAGRQEAAAGQALVYIVSALAGSNLILLLTVYFIASQRQQRVPPAPPSGTLLVLFFAAGLLCLLGSVLWLRFRVGREDSLPQREFQQQVFIAIALANINQYLGVIWVLLGGAFPLSIPFFAGPVLVILLFILPVVLKRAATLNANR